jgi:ubiquinone/menaquinone biosynthesis C-methylase UbiE
MLKELKLGGKLAVLFLQNKKADHNSDYNKVCNDYDSFFSKEMGEYALNVLKKIKIKPNNHVLELACGTGHITVEIAKQLKGQGRIGIVDQSEGMLQIAKSKIEAYKNISIDVHLGDMMEYLQSLPNDSVDIVVCGWAICYVNPVELLKEIWRVLKKEGKVGIIETREDSEKLMMDAFEKLIIEDPTIIKKYIKLKLPSNSITLKKWFARAGFKSGSCWEGANILPYSNGDDAIEWIRRSGASAGFLDVIDLKREEEIMTRIKVIINQRMKEDNNIRLSHTYVAGIARK